MKASLPDSLRLPALTLAARAYEHKRGSGIISDLTAERWFTKLAKDYDPPLPDPELTNGIIVRSMVIDYAVLDFVARHQRVAVIDLGCGFSTRKYRLGLKIHNWIDVDLPEVLQARQVLEPGSISLAIGWDLADTSKCPLDGLLETTVVNYLFLLEGVLNHLSKDHAKALLRLLHDRYRGHHVIGTVITENGLKGAQSMSKELGLSEAMWAVNDPDDLDEIFMPAKVDRLWLLGKVASRIGLIRPATGDEASGLVFLATL